MKISFRSAGTRELAVASFVLVSAACSTTTNVPPEGLIPTPVVERAIFVSLPGRGMTDYSLREQYGKNGRWAIGHVRPRCVKGDASSTCKTVDVRITAVEGAKFIDPTKPPKNPQLLAWVENLGDLTTYDGFQPSKSFVYALVVDAPPAGDAVNRPIIYMVGFSTDAKRSLISQAVYGHVYPCHDYTKHLISEADFQPCHQQQRLYGSHTEKPSLSALVTALSTWSLSPGPGDPTWFSCSSGCCTSSQPT